MTKLVFDVVGGMCELTFSFPSSTGKGPSTNPGLGFDFSSAVQLIKFDASYRGGAGVIRRADARALASFINANLSEFRDDEEAGFES